MATLGLSKVFILDKYFTELQKFWDTERRLQDASSSNEAANLHQRLRSLGTELVTLRTRLHTTTSPPPPSPPPPPPPPLPPPNNQPPPPLPPHDHQPPTVGGASRDIAPADTDSFQQQPSFSQRQADAAEQPCVSAGAAADSTSQQQQQFVMAHSASASQSAPSMCATVKPALTDSGSCKLSRLSTGGSTSGSAVTTTAAVMCRAVDDLTHLEAPLTEHAVVQNLHARFQDCQFFTNVGTILLAMNAYSELNNAITLTSVRTLPQSTQLRRVVTDAVRQHSETGYPQAIILSGSSGSGKTYTSMVLLRQLFDVAGGGGSGGASGGETDAFKHLAAAFTVLRSLGTAHTATNSESSRIGHFIEVQVTEGAIYRAKIHCYFLDQSRVVAPMSGEKNYHIFYHMLAGLSAEERARLHLEGYIVCNLNYLRHGETRVNVKEDARRFHTWKSCLTVLGIPLMDVLRVLAAILLLGNISFYERANSAEAGIEGDKEFTAVASLLGLSVATLRRALTTRTHTVRAQLVKTANTVHMCRSVRDGVAKALYCRTVATIVRRANSMKRGGGGGGSACGGTASSSDDSHLVAGDTRSTHASTVGTAGSRATNSMHRLNSAVRRLTDGFIGVLDMYGFEETRPACRLEQLCVNLCSETMQHFYNTHVFKSSLESCRDEGITCQLQLEYVDNVPCIDLISSLRNGLLSMLDAECATNGSAESFVLKVNATHRHNSRLFEPRTVDPTLFGIQHYAGKVVYSAADFIETNRDTLPDNMVAAFHKDHCSFGFVTHLFGAELRALNSAHERQARGRSFRISPTSHSAELHSGDGPASSLTQDFHTRLDNLLRTLVHARPHFIRCVRANDTESPLVFERAAVMRQIRALQLLETVNLMAAGYPHRLRYKAFNNRYRLLVPFKQLRRSEEAAVADCRLILDSMRGAAQQLTAAAMLDQCPPLVNHSSPAHSGWALGKRHIFITESTRQMLEALRDQVRQRAALTVQRTWRTCRQRRLQPVRRQCLAPPVVSSADVNHARQRSYFQPGVDAAATGSSSCRTRPQPITGTPPLAPDKTATCPSGNGAAAAVVGDRCDQNTIQHTCSLFGLDLERPPPLPPQRSYTVTGNSRLSYPQARVMRATYSDGAGGGALLKGSSVLVVGTSSLRGHLLVERTGGTVHVPYQFMELRPLPLTALNI